MTTSTNIDGDYFILIAEGGGWPSHAIGPFDTHDDAEEYLAADKWRESWGSVTLDPRDLKVVPPCGDPGPDCTEHDGACD